jgi:hypothetical protein
VSGVFDMLGVLLAIYAVYAAWSGSVFARQGPWGRMFRRDEGQAYFWSIVAIYAGLSVALIFYF